MLNPKEVLDTLDPKQVDLIGKSGNRYFGPAKEKYIWEAIDVAYFLGLDKTKNLNILDLGCGAGWFVYVAKLLGHNAYGIDRITDDLNHAHAPYQDGYKLMGIKVYGDLVYPYTPLKVDKKYDIVTTMRSFFPTRPEVWKKEEWKFFLEDLHKNIAKTNNFKLFLSINSGDKRPPYKSMLPNKKSKWGPLELEAWFHNYDFTKKIKSNNEKRKCVKGNILYTDSIVKLIHLIEVA